MLTVSQILRKSVTSSLSALLGNMSLDPNEGTVSIVAFFPQAYFKKSSHGSAFDSMLFRRISSKNNNTVFT